LNTLFTVFTGNLRKVLQKRFAVDLTEDLKADTADFQAVLGFCGKKLREKNPNEQHKVLARLKLPIYITTNADNLMADALKEAGLDPKVEICPWSDRFYAP